MEEVIFGVKTGDYKKDKYILVGIHNDSDHVYIEFMNAGKGTVYHFIIKDINEYDEFKINLTYFLEGCSNVAAAQDEFEKLDEFLYEYLDNYPEYESEMRTEKEIGEYMSEAFDRVWLVRKQNLFCNMLMGSETINADILGGCNKAIDGVCKKYNIDFQEPVSDWDYGYWSGILATLRWVMGEEKDFLDT